MTSKRKISAGAAALAAVVLALWLWRGRSDDQQAPEARVVTAAEGAIEDTIEATGAVSPMNRVEVKAPIQGRMESLLVDEGATVKRGQVMAWMSSADRAAVLDAARAQGAAEVKRWEDAYKPTPVVAPLSGVVILKDVVVGQTVDPSTILYAMSDRLIVLAQVDESDIGRIRKGMAARVTLDAYPDRSDEGEVFDVLFEGKNVSNVIQYGVKISLGKVPATYRSQMTANVQFISSRKDRAVLVPSAAVKDGPGGAKQVLVPGPDGKPVPREVTVGIDNGEQAEILSGLSAGDRALVFRARYLPQQAPQASPLTMGGGRPSSNPERERGGGGGRRRGGGKS